MRERESPRKSHCGAWIEDLGLRKVALVVGTSLLLLILLLEGLVPLTLAFSETLIANLFPRVSVTKQIKGGLESVLFPRIRFIFNLN